MDLSLVMELRKDLNQLRDQFRKVQEAYQEQAVELRDMEAHMRDLQLQLMVVIYSQPDHTVTLTEQQYDALPERVMPIQENHGDGSFSITVKEAGPDAENHH